MNTNHSSIPVLLVCTGLFLLPTGALPLLAQGPLTPPPGAPAPTMKTLEQVEPRTPISSLPFTIDASGSYYLTKDLTGVSGQSGITVSADNVTLDLNGFALIGVAGSIHGIVFPVVRNNFAVRNGTLRNWGSNGLLAGSSTNSRFERLQLFSNAQGMSAGTGSVVTDCSARSNSAGGIGTGQNSTIARCTVTSNGSTGINAGAASSVSHCTAQSNNGNGIQVGADGVISDCTVRGSTITAGIAGGTGSLVKGSTSSSNTGTAKGILVGNYSSVLNCVAANNASTGIEAGAESVIKDSVARNNGGAAGILTVDGTVSHCTASANDALGISAETVTGCTAISNGGTGITSASNVSGCTAKSNGSQGIIATKVTDSTATLNDGTGVVANLATGCIADDNNQGFNSVTSVNCAANSNATMGVSGAMAINCTATLNGGVGIVAGTATGCKTRANGSHGIQISKLALNNECSENGTAAAGGAGIAFTADRVRIDGNSCTNNDWGIQQVGSITDVLVTRNFCANNTTPPINDFSPTSNYDFRREFEGNGSVTYGPIVVKGGELDDTNLIGGNPWSNFAQ